MPGALSTAICSGLPVPRGPAILSRMGTKSRETIYGASVRAAAERAAEARMQADKLAVEAWNKRMLAFNGRSTKLLAWAVPYERWPKMWRIHWPHGSTPPTRLICQGRRTQVFLFTSASDLNCIIGKGACNDRPIVHRDSFSLA